MTIRLLKSSDEKVSNIVFLTNGDGKMLTDQGVGPTPDQWEQYAAAIAHVYTPTYLVQCDGKVGALYVREFPNLADDTERANWHDAPWQTQRAVRDAMAKLAAILDKRLFENVYLGLGTGALGRDEVMVFEPFFPVACTPSGGSGQRWNEAMNEFAITLVKPKAGFRPARAYRIALEDLRRDLLQHLQNAYGQVIESVRVWWDEDSELVRVSVVADLSIESDLVAKVEDEEKRKLRTLLENDDLGDEILHGLVSDMLGVTVIDDRSAPDEIVFYCES